jgi:hypothetical protein
MPDPRPTSWRVALIWGTVIVAVLLGVLAAAYLLIQNFVLGSIGWGSLVARTSDETHSQICRDDAGKTSSRPAYGRDRSAHRNIGTRRRISRHNAPSHRLINAEGRCCICVSIVQNARWSMAKGSCSMRRTTEHPAREGYVAPNERATPPR